VQGQQRRRRNFENDIPVIEQLLAMFNTMFDSKADNRSDFTVMPETLGQQFRLEARRQSWQWRME